LSFSFRLPSLQPPRKAQFLSFRHPRNCHFWSRRSKHLPRQQLIPYRSRTCLSRERCLLSHCWYPFCGPIYRCGSVRSRPVRRPLQWLRSRLYRTARSTTIKRYLLSSVRTESSSARRVTSTGCSRRRRRNVAHATMVRGRLAFPPITCGLPNNVRIVTRPPIFTSLGSSITVRHWAPALPATLALRRKGNPRTIFLRTAHAKTVTSRPIGRSSISIIQL